MSFLLLILFFSSCNKIDRKEKNYSELFYKYNINEVLINENGKIYQYFDFTIIDHYDSIKKDSLEFRSIKISFPLKDTIFSNHHKRNCVVVYTYKIGSKFKNDTLNQGVVDGVKIQNGFWKVKIDLSQFEFEGILSSLQNSKMEKLKLKIK